MSLVRTSGYDTDSIYALTNRPACMFKHARSVQCACLTISGCMRNSVTNICDVKVSGCTCQFEIAHGVIFM